VFYAWQKIFFENGAAAFDRAPRSRRDGGIRRSLNWRPSSSTRTR
jgi:hypothetical protein